MEIDHLWEEINEEEDIAQKRYLMFQIFDELIDRRFSIDDEKPDMVDKISQLKDIDGYLYKISQDFLTSSSTLEKENKLEKIIKHIERKEE